MADRTDPNPVPEPLPAESTEQTLPQPSPTPQLLPDGSTWPPVTPDPPPPPGYVDPLSDLEAPPAATANEP